jgi:hypothetical protein
MQKRKKRRAARATRSRVALRAPHRPCHGARRILPSIHPPFPFFPHGFSPAINAHSSSPGTSLSSVPFLVGPRIESRCVHACMCQILSLACLNLVNPCAQTAELLLPTKILHRATPLRKASQVLDDERSSCISVLFNVTDREQ